MKKQIALVALFFLGMSCFNASAQFGKKFNVGKALQAGKDAVQAITLSDADIAAISKEYMEWMDVNAFACGDGSVRICAGLMDVMNDEEVMAVIGHEIGHVIHTDSKDAMKNAYLRSAVKNAAGAASSQVARSTCRCAILTKTRVRSRCLWGRVLRKKQHRPLWHVQITE